VFVPLFSLTLVSFTPCNDLKKTKKILFLVVIAPLLLLRVCVCVYGALLIVVVSSGDKLFVLLLSISRSTSFVVFFLFCSRS